MNAPNTPPDLSHLWMPFTANRQFKANPRLLVGAKGMYYTSLDGRQILDGTSGLWCVNAGHCRAEITEAVARQAGAAGLRARHSSWATRWPSQAASAVAGLMPQDLDRIFFTNSGSESVDTALKIALAYHRARGEATRTRLIGRERGYHGVGFGGISVGGISANRKTFSGALLPAASTICRTRTTSSTTPSPRASRPGARIWPTSSERIVALHDASTIAAVIVEPMAGSTGVLMPPKGYLERLREITSSMASC